MWTDKYKLKGVVPGKLFVTGFGEVNFANPDLPVDLVERIHKSGRCPFLRAIEPPKAAKVDYTTTQWTVAKLKAECEAKTIDISAFTNPTQKAEYVTALNIAQGGAPE